MKTLSNLYLSVLCLVFCVCVTTFFAKNENEAHLYSLLAAVAIFILLRDRALYGIGQAILYFLCILFFILALVNVFYLYIHNDTIDYGAILLAISTFMIASKINTFWKIALKRQ